jgi:hypothetical protein
MTEKTTKTKPTKYIVLKRISQFTYMLVAETEVRGATAAISSVAKDEGEYVAVPLSNWTVEGRAPEKPQPPKLVPVDPAQLTLEASDAPAVAEIVPDSRRAELHETITEEAPV